MKIIVFLWLACGAVIQSAFAQLDPDFPATLEAFSKERGRNLDKTQANRIVDSWPGIRTMAGVRSLVAELLKPNRETHNHNDVYEILARSHIPREQIVAYVLEGANAARGATFRELWSYFGILSEFPEDDRVLKFFADSLDDKRQPPPEPPTEKFIESDGVSPYRICDHAFGNLKEILEKRGEIAKYDPAYGQPGGEPFQKDRDRCIAALKPFLIKAGYLAAETKPPVARPAQPNALSPSAGSQSGNRQSEGRRH